MLCLAVPVLILCLCLCCVWQCLCFDSWDWPAGSVWLAPLWSPVATCPLRPPIMNSLLYILSPCPFKTIYKGEILGAGKLLRQTEKQYSRKINTKVEPNHLVTARRLLYFIASRDEKFLKNRWKVEYNILDFWDILCFMEATAQLPPTTWSKIFVSKVKNICVKRKKYLCQK